MLLSRQRILSLLFILATSTTTYAQEVSTWPFADNIGWKGVQAHYGFYMAKNPIIDTRSGLKALTKPENHGLYDSSYANSDPYLLANYKSLHVFGVFVPFRKAKNKWLAKAEWQSGFELQLQKHHDEFRDSAYRYDLMHINRSLLWKNRLLFQQSLAPNVKFYAGPSASVSIVPAYSLSQGKQSPHHSELKPVYDESLQLNRARFIAAGGLAAGFKINLSCRFNFHFEYEYMYTAYVMETGSLGRGYHGASIGITYKFMKPGSDGDTEKSPFW